MTLGLPPVAANLDNFPIGTVISSPANLEYITGKRWRCMNGQDLNRSDVNAAFAQLFPQGPLNSFRNGTAAVVVGAATQPAIDASPLNFVAAAGAVANTTGIQYSTDGTTWSQTSVVTPSALTSCIRWVGSRWCLAGSAAVNGPAFTSGDNPGSTWTAVSSVFQPNNVAGFVDYVIAYSPQLALTAILPQATNAVHTIPDGSTTNTSRSRTANGNSKGIVWTGQRFLIVGTNSVPQYQWSTDGITWNDSNTATTGVGFGHNVTNMKGVASDGNGNVVICFDHYFLVSHDHGVTWGKVYPPLEYAIASTEVYSTTPFNPIWAVRYVKDQVTSIGRFVAFTGTAGASNASLLFSYDGTSWYQERPFVRGNNAATIIHSLIAMKAGVMVGVIGNSTSTGVANEDSTKFRLPATFRPPEVTTLQPSGWDSHQEYIKVK